MPLLREARELWREIETAAGVPLLTTTGIVEIGPPDGELVRGTLASSDLHDLPHQILDAAALTRRFPAFAVPPAYIGILQPDGGFLAAEEAVKAQIGCPRRRRACEDGTRVASLEPLADGVRLTMADGETLEAATAIVAAGPWLASLLPRPSPLLRVTRQVLGWLSPPSPAQFTSDRFPVFLFESPLGLHYGFPVHGDHGLKLAKHHHLDETGDPGNGYPVGFGARSAGHSRVPRPVCAVRHRPARADDDLPLHHDAGWPLHSRPAPRRTAGDHRLGLLRSWLQVRAGHRRHPCRPCDLRRDDARHLAVSPVPLRSHLKPQRSKRAASGAIPLPNCHQVGNDQRNAAPAAARKQR